MHSKDRLIFGSDLETLKNVQSWVDSCSGTRVMSHLMFELLVHIFRKIQF